MAGLDTCTTSAEWLASIYNLVNVTTAVCVWFRHMPIKSLERSRMHSVSRKTAPGSAPRGALPGTSVTAG